MLTYLDVDNVESPFSYKSNGQESGIYNFEIGIIDSLSGGLSYYGSEIYLENGYKYSILLTKSAGRKVTVVTSNSPIDSIFQQFYNRFMSYHYRRFKLEEELAEANSNGSKEKQKKIGDELKAFPKALRKFIKGYIVEYKNNPASAYILSHYMVESDSEILRLYEMLSAEVKEHPLGVELKVRRISPILNEKKYGLNKTLPVIEGVDSNAIERSVYDYKSKITLVLFWADYCIPCRDEHPELVKIYSRYKELGFEIVSYSIRRDDKSWKNAIRQDKLFWPQLRVNTKPQEEFVKNLGVLEIPYSFLIDEKGKILAKNLTLPQLVKFLDANLKVRLQ